MTDSAAATVRYSSLCNRSREFEDLEALVNETGGSRDPSFCLGIYLGLLWLSKAICNPVLGIKKLALFEPPSLLHR